MAVFKNGIFAYDNGRPVTPQQVGIDYPGIQTCQQFFSSGSITNVTQRSALYILVGDLQNYGIWNKMKAIYPMVGQAGVSSSFELNLKDPNTFRGIFNGGWTFSSTGATPDGSTGYMNTTFIPANHLEGLGNAHLSFYSRTQTNTSGWDIGSAGLGIGKNLELTFISLNQIFRTGDTPDYRAAASLSTSKGFILGSATSLNLSKLYINNNVEGTNTTSNTNVSLPSTSTLIGATRQRSTTSPTSFSDRECAFASIGDGLTDTEATNLYTAVQRFQTTLGRQV